MKKQYWIGLVVVVAVVVGGMLYAKNSATTPTQTIKIGAVLGLTGSAAEDSLNVKRGLDLARQDLAKKGINVEIIYQDDQTDPKHTVSAIQQMVATDRPQAIVGPIWSFLQSAAGPVLAANKLISYAPANTSEFVTLASKYEFQGAPRNALIVEPTVKWLKSNNITRVAIIADNSSWGVNVAQVFEQTAQQAGAAVVVKEMTTAFSSDAPVQAANAVLKAKAAGAEVILWTGYEPEATALVQKRMQLGYQVPVIAMSTTYQQLLSAGTLNPSDLKNVYFLSVPMSPDFVKKFTDAYGVVPGNYSDRAYDGLMILVDAIQHAPAQDADSIANYLRTKTKYKGYGGVYEFNENGDVKGGKWVIQPVVAQ